MIPAPFDESSVRVATIEDEFSTSGQDTIVTIKVAVQHRKFLSFGTSSLLVPIAIDPQNVVKSNRARVCDFRCVYEYEI